MNRQQRRAAERKAAKVGRSNTIARATGYLADIADPTATGATLIMPDGEMVYVSIETARAMAANKLPAKAQ